MQLRIAVLLAWALPSIALPQSPPQTYYDEVIPFSGSFSGHTYENGTQVIWSDKNPDAPFTRHISESALASFHQHKRDLKKREMVDCWGYQLDVRLTDLTTSEWRWQLDNWGPVHLSTIPNPPIIRSWWGFAFEAGGPMVYACINSRNKLYAWTVTSAHISRGLIDMDAKCRRYEAGYATLNAANDLLVGKTLATVPVCLGGYP
ncbi:hypothetical protein NW768_011714 [Fusarium equiseti]|uniref:Uncharacterized protein n=1 Tax=Fusarium equiseti TaxID=61235 RepID=A0ABQ8QXC1_FUSEQ|nr:hypothetical protein NW768_011714 [Fusarium equiseti]